MNDFHTGLTTRIHVKIMEFVEDHPDVHVTPEQIKELDLPNGLATLRDLIKKKFLWAEVDGSWTMRYVAMTDEGHEAIQQYRYWAEKVQGGERERIASLGLPDLSEYHLARARLGFFEEEDPEDNKWVAGYTLESTWNGWRFPLIPKENIPQALELLYQDEDYRYTWNGEVFTRISEGEVDVAQVYEIEGMVLYDLSFGLVWEVDPDYHEDLGYDYDPVFAAEPDVCPICGPESKLHRSTYQVVGQPPYAVRDCWGDKHRDEDNPRRVHTNRVFEMEIPRKETK